MTNGIDMSRSSWENPDGWTPRERTERAPAPEPVCEATGPDGWVCDLKPNHRSEEHEADAGDRKVRWPRRMITSQGTYAPAPEPRAVNETPRVSGTWNPLDGEVPESSRAWDEAQNLAQIHAIASAALGSQAPADLAIALFKIQEMTRDY
jgi:hypothetical protein